MEDTLLGSGPSVERIRNQINQAVESGVNILIYGENGVGKELAARNIYRKSSRQEGPFVKINCEILPKMMLSSKLYGNEGGFFSGTEPNQGRQHKISNGCVLFFDKIHVIPLSIQAEIFQMIRRDKLLQPGLNRSKSTGPLILSTSTHALEPDVQEGKFDEKLYHLINGMQIYIPPLRNRTEEIPTLIDYYLEKYAFQFKNSLPLQPDSNVIQQLMRYQWPENIDQLRDVVQRFLTLGDWTIIVEELLSSARKTSHSLNMVS